MVLLNMVEVGGGGREERLNFGFGPKLNKVKLLYGWWQFHERGPPRPHSPIVSDGAPMRVGDDDLPVAL